MRNKSIYRLISALAIVGGLCFAGPAFALPVSLAPCTPADLCVESELNNDAPPAPGSNANDLGSLTLLGLSVDGGIELEEDLDFFSFTLPTTSLVQLTTGPGAPELGLLDTVLTLFDGSGAEVVNPNNPNDDGGPFGTDPPNYSQIPFFELPGGVTYFVLVEGDTTIGEDSEGNPITIHETGGYILLIERTPIRDGAAVPEPASLVLLGSGLAGLALWRRKRA